MNDLTQSAVSCFDQPGQLSVAQGREKVMSLVSALAETELCSLANLTGRVLAEDLVSPINVPAQTNSAMDGFALCLPETAVVSEQWALVGESYAGHGFAGSLAPGQAVLITTGAPVPEGANTVVMKEFARVEGDVLLLERPDAVRPGENIRQAGEDLSQGSVALEQGIRLQAQHQGLIASLGYTGVKVYRKVRVAVFSTGDEVVAQGQSLPAHSIYDTNRFTLQGLLKKLDCDVTDLGILPDDEVRLTQALSEAASDSDVVISSGGVSVGDADYIKGALNQVGQTGFWRLNLRPGRPFACGLLDKATDETSPRALFYGLPGNPVAVMVTFLQLVQPALRKLAGEKNWAPCRIPVESSEKMRSRLGRTDFHRGIFSVSPEGKLVVRTTGSQGSGILRSMVEANCLIEISDDVSAVAPGDSVMIQPFADLL